MADTATTSRIEYAGPDFFQDPHAYYRRWRARGPVLRVRFDDGGACWVVIGYAEGRAALADPRLHKGYEGAVRLFRTGSGARLTGVDEQALHAHMLNSDPPDHTRLRKLVTKAFTQRRVSGLRLRIEEIAGGLADAMAAHDEADLIAAFAQPLPVMVICELLGVPFADRDAFQGWTKILLGSRVDTDTRARANREMAEYMRKLLGDKRACPGDDLISGLVQASSDGDKLSEGEVVSMAFLLLVAGHETTVNLIGNGSYALLRNRSQFEALRADPDAIPAAVEEFLRYDGPIGWSTMRYTTEPVRIGDTDIPADEFVYIALSAANRDPARYADPDTADLGGDPSGHVAFGHGIHFCVGAPLARLEAAIAFSTLLQRFPRLRLADPASVPVWQQSTLIHGLTALPVRVH